MRITPLLSGDQPFVSWHSIQLCFHISITNTPRGHEDGELIYESISRYKNLIKVKYVHNANMKFDKRTHN